MKTLLLLAFLAAATFCLCHAADVDADAAAAAQANGPKKDSEAFVSRKESAQVVHRNKKRGDRLLQALSGPAVTPDPLEPFREVCETNPSCDELADQIGFREAYRRFYGPI